MNYFQAASLLSSLPGMHGIPNWRYPVSKRVTTASRAGEGVPHLSGVSPSNHRPRSRKAIYRIPVLPQGLLGAHSRSSAHIRMSASHVQWSNKLAGGVPIPQVWLKPSPISDKYRNGSHVARGSAPQDTLVYTATLIARTLARHDPSAFSSPKTQAGAYRSSNMSFRSSAHLSLPKAIAPGLDPVSDRWLIWGHRSPCPGGHHFLLGRLYRLLVG